MARTIKIPGRFESSETGNIVAGANAILDDVKGKKQNVINQETDAAIAALESGKQDMLTFDNVPTEGSNNPVKSAGVYTATFTLSQAIEAILLLIPAAASELNKLADKDFVNSSIATDTATFRGTSAPGLSEQQFLAWANTLTHDLNDYVFWNTVDSVGNTQFKRYKWNGEQWMYEYTLNNSSFTAEQWEAINSGITQALVAKLSALPTASGLQIALNAKQDNLTFDDEPTAGSSNPVKSSGILAALNVLEVNKQDKLTFDNSPTQGSTNPVYSGGVYMDIKNIVDLIPLEATVSNLLADRQWVLNEILGGLPNFKGYYDSYAILEAVTGMKAGDIAIIKTTDSDGYQVLSFYQYINNAWVLYFTVSHVLQNKPATTGTTGDYPYNGMGKVVLPKNMVNVGTEAEPEYVNTLTQDMFYKGEAGSRVPNEKTVFVIQYDFVIDSANDNTINIPLDCVLLFDGGSISNGTLNGLYTEIIEKDRVLHNIDLTGSFTNATFNTMTFGIDQRDHNYNTSQFKKLLSFCNYSGERKTIIVSAPCNINDTLSFLNTQLMCLDTIYVMEGSIDNKPALSFDTATLSVKGLEHTIKLHYKTTESTRTLQQHISTNNVGVELKNCSDCKFNILSIRNFTTGIHLYGNNDAVHNNYINSGAIINSYYGIKFDRDGASGSVNENTIVKPHMSYISTFPALTGECYAFYFDYDGENPHVYNNNTVIDPNIEGAKVGIYTRGPIRNSRFLNVRDEGVRTLIEEYSGMVFVPHWERTVVTPYRIYSSYEDNNVLTPVETLGNAYNTFVIKSDILEFPRLSGCIKYFNTATKVAFSAGQPWTIDDNYVKSAVIDGVDYLYMEKTGVPLAIMTPKNGVLSFVVKVNLLDDSKVCSVLLNALNSSYGSTGVNWSSGGIDKVVTNCRFDPTGSTTKTTLSSASNYRISNGCQYISVCLKDIDSSIKHVFVSLIGLGYEYEIIKYSEFELIDINVQNVYILDGKPTGSYIKNNNNVVKGFLDPVVIIDDGATKKPIFNTFGSDWVYADGTPA